MTFVYIKGLYKQEQMTETKPIVSVENVVASASVDQKIDLNEITKKFPDVIIEKSHINLGYAGGCNLGSKIAKFKNY